MCKRNLWREELIDPDLTWVAGCLAGCFLGVAKVVAGGHPSKTFKQ
jgi:hypothetical protein